MAYYTCSKCGSISNVMSTKLEREMKCCEGDKLVLHKFTPNAQPKQIDVRTVTVEKELIVEVVKHEATPQMIIQKQNIAKTITAAPAASAGVTTNAPIKVV